MRKIDLFKDYENAKVVSVEEYRASHEGVTYRFDRLPKQNVEGIPVCMTRDGKGHLNVSFVPDSHLLAIGATRSGKTTGFVIPTIHAMASKKNKPSMVISDPKQELYRSCAKKFTDNGYRVLMLDFTNYSISDCWNPLTKYYRLYQKYLNVESLVEIVKTEKGPKNRFMGRIYDDQIELDKDIEEKKEEYMDEVEKGITALCATCIPNTNVKDPFWDDSARDLLMALFYGMLEDSESGEITEELFSFDTALRIFDTFTDINPEYDNGYFGRRNIKTSRALQLAKKCILEQANTTRRCISSEFAAKMNKFRDTAVRRITARNTFEIQELDDGKPTVIFVCYKDEESLHYEIISLFLTNLYTELIAISRKKGTRLRRPFYFLLDEFGNLPAFKDFDKVISACAGRNVWFLLILQSYAQLNNIYGRETAEIIKDNLNIHIFFGTNNPDTKREFSEECGRKTILSPVSALNGAGETIERYDKDTVSLVPVSALTSLKPGECIVTQMREDVLWSWFERSYTCPEFDIEPTDPFDRKMPNKERHQKYQVSERKNNGFRHPVDDMFAF